MIKAPGAALLKISGRRGEGTLRGGRAAFCGEGLQMNSGGRVTLTRDYLTDLLKSYLLPNQRSVQEPDPAAPLITDRG